MVLFDSLLPKYTCVAAELCLYVYMQTRFCDNNTLHYYYYYQLRFFLNAYLNQTSRIFNNDNMLIMPSFVSPRGS